MCICSYPVQEPESPELLFDMDVISEALRSSGHDTSRLSAPFIPQPVGLGKRKFVSLNYYLEPFNRIPFWNSTFA